MKLGLTSGAAKWTLVSEFETMGELASWVLYATSLTNRPHIGEPTAPGSRVTPLLIPNSHLWGNRLSQLFEYVFDGTVESVVESTYPLEKFATVFERLVDPDLLGKMILTQ
jgi:hypothetical protein